MVSARGRWREQIWRALRPQSAAREAEHVAVPALVPVTLHVQNTAPVGDLSFFYTAESFQDFAWLGCETSEVIRLPPLRSHTATLHALFPAAGVFNLNRLRFSVVGMSSGAVPATEQAPVAFTFPYERLVRITG